MDRTADRLIQRRLYLMRYITSLTTEVLKTGTRHDKRLMRLINAFIENADDRTINSLAMMRLTNRQVSEFFKQLRAHIRDQRDETIELLKKELQDLAEREVRQTAKIMGVGKPSAGGIALLPVLGEPFDVIVKGVFVAYTARVISEIVKTAGNAPDDIAKVVKGTRSNNYRDSLFFWRNERNIIPEIDAIVNGVSSHASNKVFKAAGVEKVDFMATLDFRTCLRCATAEKEGPYPLGEAPSIPVHNRCRCVHVPHDPINIPERPYVRDARSVKDIPKSQRLRKIGLTRMSIDDFFDRMTQEERRDYMGASRAELWRQGKINDVADLVQQRTLRPLTLDELPEV